MNEDRLFAGWAEKLVHDGVIKEACEFITDGVVNENEYTHAKLKILFILKEVNNYNGDLREFLADGGRPETWDNVSRWSEGVFNIDKEYKWSELWTDEKVNFERRKQFLPSICAMNLKKTSGGHTTDKSKFWKAASRDINFLKKQYALYSPDITICCGTTAEFFNTIYKGNPHEWLQTSRGIWYVKNGESFIIEYAHPEARIKPNLLYYGLIDAVREIISL